MTHEFLLGSLKFLDSNRLRHVIVHQAPSDVVAEFLRNGNSYFWGKMYSGRQPELSEQRDMIRSTV
jgi:hypothetical protein